MRYSFVFLLFFVFSLKVFSQKASPKFVEGEIYFKVKPEFAKKFAAENFKNIDDSREFNKSLEQIKKSEDYKALMQKNDKFFKSVK